MDPAVRSLEANIRWRRRDGTIQQQLASVDLDRCHTVVLGQATSSGRAQ
jgi:hypothetical protein